MYIIEEGKAYLVDGEVGYLANFDTTGKMIIDKEKTIDVLGKVVYTFDEMYAKLNIAYKIQEAINKNAMNKVENEIIDKLNAKIDELEKENKELEEQLEALKTTEIHEKEAVVEEKKETKVETNKKEKK